MKTVLITGANRGLGEALCLCFADAGWHVIATARNINLLKEKPNVTYLELDLSNYDSIQALSNTIQTEGYKIEFLINNAGYNPKDSQDKAYFQNALKGSVFLSDVQVSELSGNPVFIISAPIRMSQMSDDSVIGVLYGVVDLPYFTKKFVEAIKIGQDGYVFIFNKNI